MKTLGKTFLQGLAAIVPIAITIYVLYWIGATAESFLGGLIRKLLPEAFHVPGVGLAFTIVLIFLVGAVLNLWLLRRVFAGLERLFDRIPLVKTLYGSVRDLMSFFPSPDARKASPVVMVRIRDTDLRLLGVLTREGFDDLPAGIGSEGDVAVYLPMSYQVGGFTTIVPRSMVEPVDMSFEDAMRFAVTAGMPGRKDDDARHRDRV